MHMHRGRDVTRIVKAVRELTGLATPIKPEVLAVALGLELEPRPHCRRYALRKQTIVFDPCLPDFAECIAHGCAAYLLRKAGVIKTTEICISDLAIALCGPNVSAKQQMPTPQLLFSAGGASRFFV